MSQSLFPQFGNVFGGGNTSGRNELVAFNAGKMTVKPTSSGKVLITPETKKGKVALTRGDDQLLHFQWIDRQTGASVEDFIIFPDDASFEKVDTGRPGDRVFILQYKNSSRRFFFWMQSKDDSRDEEIVRKVNDYMNNAQQAPSATGDSRTGANNVQLDHNAIMQMLGAMNSGEQGRGSNASGQSGAAAQSSVQMAELQNILQNMGLPANQQSAASSPATSAASSSQVSQNGGGSSAAATTASTQQEHDVSGMDVDEMSEEELLRLAIEESMRDTGETTERSTTEQESTSAAQDSASATSFTPATAPATSAPQNQVSAEDLQRAMAFFQGSFNQRRQGISLMKLLSASNVAGILDDDEAVEQLLPLLPESAQTKEELRATLHSPQLRQGIASLVGALETGNYNAVLTNFSLDPNAGANEMARGDSVGAFLAALQHWAAQQENEDA